MYTFPANKEQSSPIAHASPPNIRTMAIPNRFPRTAGTISNTPQQQDAVAGTQAEKIQ